MRIPVCCPFRPEAAGHQTLNIISGLFPLVKHKIIIFAIIFSNSPAADGRRAPNLPGTAFQIRRSMVYFLRKESKSLSILTLLDENRSKMSRIGTPSINACCPADVLTCSIFGRRNIVKIIQTDTVTVVSVPNTSSGKTKMARTLSFLKKENPGKNCLSIGLAIHFLVWLITQPGKSMRHISSLPLWETAPIHLWKRSRMKPRCTGTRDT